MQKRLKLVPFGSARTLRHFRIQPFNIPLCRMIKTPKKGGSLEWHLIHP